MSKLFVQYVKLTFPMRILPAALFFSLPRDTRPLCQERIEQTTYPLCYSGLSWHTNDDTLREGFQQFGEIQEAVSSLFPATEPHSFLICSRV
jgi:hypothetical protein